MPSRILSAFLWSQRRLLVWGGVIALAVGLVLYCKRGDLTDYFEAYDKKERLQDEVDRLRAENEQLQRDLEDLPKGGFKIEKVARERYRFSKPGEIVLFIDQPTDKTTTATTLTSATLPTTTALQNLPRP